MKRCFGKLAGFVAVFVMVWCPLASAQQSSSTNYQVNEVYFGSGGDLNDCSTNYCSKQAAGELGVGNTASTNYQAQGGFNTDRTPYIQFNVTAGSTDLGVLSVGAAATATGTFSVKTYLAGGYVVKNASDPPTNTLPSHPVMHNLTTPTASSPGTEQFGINLVANSAGCGAPTTYGANPIQIPNSTFSFGTVASGYNTCGLFKYVKGDVIAQSTRSTGETDYTISYLYNISNVTSAGQYTFNHILVATSTY
ncbi:MAG: hypothetical protein ACQR33_05515 [Candidatus Saccharibacteria bacterium]